MHDQMTWDNLKTTSHFVKNNPPFVLGCDGLKRPGFILITPTVIHASVNLTEKMWPKPSFDE